jgi:signal transduction histidine kinase
VSLRGSSRRALAGLIAVNTGALLVGFVALPAESFARTVVVDLGELTAALLAAVAFFLAARDSRERAGAPAFLALGAGCLCWGLGQAVWSWYELVWRIESPFPSFADLGFLSGVALLAVGVALWPKHTRRFGAGALADAGLFAGVAAIFSLEFVIAPVVHSVEGFSFEAAILLSYPLIDLALFTAVIGGILVRGWDERGRLLVVSASLFALVFADTYYSLVGDDYVTGAIADLGWVAAFVLAGIAALLPSGWQRDRAARIRPGAVTGVLTCLIAFLVALDVLEAWGRDRIGAIDTFGIGLLLVLLVARTSQSARVRAREAGVLAGAQAELAQAYAVRDGALEASRTGVCVFDSEGEARFANSAFVALLGPARSWSAFVTRIGLLTGGKRAEPGQALQLWNDEGRFLAVAFAPLPTGDLLATADDLTDQQREREFRGRMIAETVAAQEREARRIGELLHDDAVQQLTALGLRLELEAQRSGEPKLAELAAGCGAIISTLRHLLAELHPAVLESQGLSAAVDDAAEMLRSNGVEVNVEPFDQRLAPEFERLAFGLVEEGLTNVHQHASASRVVINFSLANESLRCRVTDNGLGFETHRLESAVKEGKLGLHIVGERLDLAGGRLLVESRPDHGTAFTFELPLAPEAILPRTYEVSA